MKLYKLKQDKKEIFLNWGILLQTKYLAEVKETLKQENCTKELFNFFELNNEFYVIGHMEGDNFVKPELTELNIQHKQILKDCFEASIELKEVYNIKSN
jgi:hypothetical protein